LFADLLRSVVAGRKIDGSGPADCCACFRAAIRSWIEPNGGSSVAILTDTTVCFWVKTDGRKNEKTALAASATTLDWGLARRGAKHSRGAGAKVVGWWGS
jgi:hypothetical protein